jgi:hypothetical protein
MVHNYFRLAVTWTKQVHETTASDGVPTLLSSSSKLSEGMSSPETIAS